MSRKELLALQQEVQQALQIEAQQKMITINGQRMLLDSDVAQLYGVETRALNQAVKRNPEKFPAGYIYKPDNQEVVNLKSQNVTASWGGNRKSPVAFTEKGLYMLATILKSPRATAATFAIIEAFAAVRELKRELVELHKEQDPDKQQKKMAHFGEMLSEIVMPDLETTETESSLELNFVIGKIKHTVRRIKRNGDE